MPYIPRDLNLSPNLDGDPTYRMSILPFGTYANPDGQGEHLGFAVPGMIHEPVNALMRLLGTPSNPGTFTQGPDYGSNSDDMRTLLETFTGGNAEGAMLGRGARAALPMDEASRLARAQEMGFDTSTPLYHGSRNNPKPFDQFDMSKVGTGSDEGFFGRGVYATPDEWRGQNYAGPDGHVRSLYGRMENPFDWEMMSPAAADYLKSMGADLKNPSSVTAALKGAGHDGVRVRYPGDATTQEHVFFDPSQLRDVNAAFDPARAGDPGLLLSDTGRPSLMGGVVAGEQAPIRAYHGTTADMDGLFQPSAGGKYGPGLYAGYGDAGPSLADVYASPHGRGQFDDGRVYPLDVTGPIADHGAFFDRAEQLRQSGIANPDAQIVEELRNAGYSGVGDGSVLNIFQPGTARSPLTGETLFSDGRPSLMGSAVAGAEKNAASPGFDVWHGSPHDFDKFDMSKIGSGEGAQAYGHGLYFADQPSVAENYRSAGGAPVNSTAAADAYIQKLQEWNSGGRKGPVPSPDEAPGYLYQARINADPEHFLDWDKPLNQQSEAVRRAFPDDLHPMVGSQAHDELSTRLASPVPESETGWEYVVNTINDKVQRRDRAADALREAGIPGIKYLDAGSRGAADGPRNYVVFDHTLVDTLHKWRGDQQLYSGGGLGLAPPQPDPNDPRYPFITY